MNRRDFIRSLLAALAAALVPWKLPTKATGEVVPPGVRISKDKAVDLALSFYTNEPCRICGELITQEQVRNAVFAGYSLDNKARSAHGVCWDKNIPKEQWAYNEDDID